VPHIESQAHACLSISIQVAAVLEMGFFTAPFYLAAFASYKNDKHTFQYYILHEIFLIIHDIGQEPPCPSLSQ
jgi:hypothetical protein